MAGTAKFVQMRGRFSFFPWRMTCGFRFYSQTPFTKSLIKDGRDGAQEGELYVPVLIVGAGPVGLVLSFFLTKLGIKCAVLEKSVSFSHHPQAHFINNRSMELFRKMDELAEEIEKLQPPLDHWRKFIYCTSLTGTILGSVDHIKPQDFQKPKSPTFVAHFSQYKLTSLLLRKLESIGFFVSSRSNIEDHMMLEKKILIGHECVSINPFQNGVKVGTSFFIDGKSLEKKILCEILVGADGANSNVRKLAGIEMEGERNLQKLISVHFLSKDLGKYILSERPGMLFFIFNPYGIGVLVAHDLSQGEFVLQMPFYPPQQCLEDFSPRVCEEIISKLAGWKLMDLKIVDIKPWVMHAEVAERFSALDGRIFLAGDAAHRFPPAGGFGMNTGIQDAHNLAWKIASVLNGIASSSLLQTYEMERRPVALFNTKLSVENFRAATSVPSALGLNPDIANTVHEAISKGIGSILPSTVQKTIMEGIFAIGRAQVSDFLLKENYPLMSSRLAKMRSILDEGKSLQLQFPAQDLGFTYLKGALVGRDDTNQITDGYARKSRDYVPSSEPGSRLPHFPLRLINSSGRHEDVISTLDLIAPDKLEFVLIIAPEKRSYDLALAAFRATEELGVALKVCVIWPQGSFDDKNLGGSGGALAPWKNYVDAEEVKSLSSWWETCKMSSRGSIMVRPDDHIAWRTTAELGGDVVDQMRRLFSTILGRSDVFG